MQIPYRVPAQYDLPAPAPRRWRTRLGNCLYTCGVASFFISLFIAAGLIFYVFNPPPPQNVLLLGNDARPGTGEDEIARTDSIMVLGVNAENREVNLLSVPRDVTITSPTFGNLRANTIVRNAELEQPGSGIAEMIASMENTFNADIDHSVRVSFQGFVDLVDALGGITIDVPSHIIDYTYPTHDGGTMVIEFQAGEQKMDGENALIYARTRHGDSDYERARRQQQVIDAILGKLRNPLNLYRLPGVMAAFFNNVETDMGIGDLLMVAPGVLLYGHGSNLNRLVLDNEYLSGGYPDMTRVDPWVQTHLR